MDFQWGKDFAELPACKVIRQLYHQPLGFFDRSKECVHMDTMETTLVYLVSTTQKMFKQKFDLAEHYWEIVADNLTNAGWSWGCVSAVPVVLQAKAPASQMGAKTKPRFTTAKNGPNI